MDSILLSDILWSSSFLIIWFFFFQFFYFFQVRFQTIKMTFVSNRTLVTLIYITAVQCRALFSEILKKLHFRKIWPKSFERNIIDIVWCFLQVCTKDTFLLLFRVAFAIDVDGDGVMWSKCWWMTWPSIAVRKEKYSTNSRSANKRRIFRLFFAINVYLEAKPKPKVKRIFMRSDFKKKKFPQTKKSGSFD